MAHLYGAEWGLSLVPCCICGRAPVVRRMSFPARTLIQCRRKTRRTMHVVATYYADPATAAREWNRYNERPAPGAEGE